MIGLFWNIRGLNKIGRLPALIGRIRSTHADVVGIIETKKESFTPGYLKSLSGNVPFKWFWLPAKGTAGGILAGCNSDKYIAYVCDSLEFSISLMIKDCKTDFYWKLVIVYGSPYENGKLDFLNELNEIM